MAPLFVILELLTSFSLILYNSATMSLKNEQSRVLVHLRDAQPLERFGTAEVKIESPIRQIPKDDQEELAKELVKLSLKAGLVEEIKAKAGNMTDVILVERLVNPENSDPLKSSVRTEAFYASDAKGADGLPLVVAYYRELEQWLAGDGVGVALEQKDGRTVLE